MAREASDRRGDLPCLLLFIIPILAGSTEAAMAATATGPMGIPTDTLGCVTAIGAVLVIVVIVAATGIIRVDIVCSSELSACVQLERATPVGINR